MTDTGRTDGRTRPRGWERTSGPGENVLAPHCLAPNEMRPGTGRGGFEAPRAVDRTRLFSKKKLPGRRRSTPGEVGTSIKFAFRAPGAGIVQESMPKPPFATPPLAPRFYTGSELHLWSEPLPLIVKLCSTGLAQDTTSRVRPEIREMAKAKGHRFLPSRSTTPPKKTPTVLKREKGQKIFAQDPRVKGAAVARQVVLVAFW